MAKGKIGSYYNLVYIVYIVYVYEKSIQTLPCEFKREEDV